MAGSEGGEGLQNIFKLSARPQHVIAQKNDETVDIEPEGMTTMVYIRDCTKCRMTLKKKPAKLAIENCQDLVLILKSGLVSGTLEVIKSSNVSISVEEEVKISTITADSTNALRIILCKDEKQLESLFSHQSGELSITVGTGEGKKEFAVTRPPNDPDYLQFISQWETKEGGVMKLATAKVVRDGTYPYTEKQLNEARKRDRENAEKCAKFLEEKFFSGKKK